jgi:hypothetical protein
MRPAGLKELAWVGPGKQARRSSSLRSGLGSGLVPIDGTKGLPLRGPETSIRLRFLGASGVTATSHGVSDLKKQ